MNNAKHYPFGTALKSWSPLIGNLWLKKGASAIKYDTSHLIFMTSLFMIISHIICYMLMNRVKRQCQSDSRVFSISHCLTAAEWMCASSFEDLELNRDFNGEDYEYEDEAKLVIFPDHYEIPLPNIEELPALVSELVLHRLCVCCHACSREGASTSLPLLPPVLPRLHGVQCFLFTMHVQAEGSLHSWLL